MVLPFARPQMRWDSQLLETMYVLHPTRIGPYGLRAGYPEHTQQAVEAEAARAERSFAREPSPAPDHLRYGGMTQAPLVRQLFAGLGGGAGGAGGGSHAAGFARAASGPHTEGAVGSRIVLGRTGRGGTRATATVGGRGETGGRPPSGGSGSSVHDGFASTLEHHRQNVIAVTVPPVQAVGAGGFVPETLIRGSGGGGGSSGNGRPSKPDAA